jgi:hypothetical protein
MQHCIHPLDEFRVHGESDVEAQYCRAALCLLCRRRKAIEERRVLKRLLEAAQSTAPVPLLFFQTLTMADCPPAEVSARAGLLVKAFSKLRRMLPHHLGWARVIEVKASDFNPDLENVHLHFVALFPVGLSEDVNAIQWDGLWRKCAGELARDCDPDARFAEDTESVVHYLTKAMVWDFEEDGKTGIEDPGRYVHRVHLGHSKFSSGGKLRLRTAYSELDKACGLDLVTPVSTLRSQSRQLTRPVHDGISIEGATPEATEPRRRR